jgi:hypothetical protein
MAYNRWITYSDELYHYGVLGMKWGVHRVRSLQPSKKDLKAQGLTEFEIKKRMAKNASNAEKANAIRSRIDTKASRKLERINTKYEKKQMKADRKFDKAERKANSFFSSKKSAERAFRKASKAQFKANKVAARGKKWYERMTKEYKRADISMSKRNQEIGKELIRQVRANSRAMYAATYVRG